MNRCRWLDLCPLEDLSNGAARGFDPFDEGRDALFVVRRGDHLNAYRNQCPHQGASLPWQKNAYLSADGTKIVCSAHGARFYIDSGKCALGPALGRSLERVVVSVTEEGMVRARLSVNP
jgi:nitrite reductase/ring-hydroxylating ferredoxin subunit